MYNLSSRSPWLCSRQPRLCYRKPAEKMLRCSAACDIHLVWKLRSWQNSCDEHVVSVQQRASHGMLQLCAPIHRSSRQLKRNYEARCLNPDPYLFILVTGERAEQLMHTNHAMRVRSFWFRGRGRQKRQVVVRLDLGEGSKSNAAFCDFAILLNLTLTPHAFWYFWLDYGQNPSTSPRARWLTAMPASLWPQLALILATSCFLAIFMITQSSASNINGDFFCNANGAPSYFATRDGFYEPFWDPKLFFNFNVPFGHLSYTSAKIIDACWDLAFARGGQALVGLLSYRVIRRSLALVMEQSPVAMPLATAICCENGNLTLLGRLFHSF